MREEWMPGRQGNISRQGNINWNRPTGPVTDTTGLVPDTICRTCRRRDRRIVPRLAIDKMSGSAVVRTLGLGWNTVNALVVLLTRELVLDVIRNL